eukprot:gene7460-8247_t
MSEPTQQRDITSMGDSSVKSISSHPSQNNSERFRVAALLVTSTNGTPRTSTHDRNKQQQDEDDPDPSDEENGQTADDKKRTNFRFDRLTFSDSNLLKLSLFNTCLESLTFQDDTAVINWNQVYNNLLEDPRWQPFQPFSMHRLKVAYKAQLSKILEALPPDEEKDDILPEFMKIARGLSSVEVKMKKKPRKSSKIACSTTLSQPVSTASQAVINPTEMATQSSSSLEQCYVEDERREAGSSEADALPANDLLQSTTQNVEHVNNVENKRKRTEISQGDVRNKEALTERATSAANSNSLIEHHKVKSPKQHNHPKEQLEQADSMTQEVACDKSDVKTEPPSNKRARYALNGLSLAHVLVDDKNRDNLADFLEEHRSISSIEELLDAADVSAEGKRIISKQFKLTRPAMRLLRPIGEILLSSLITPSFTTSAASAATTQVNVLQEKLGLGMGDTMDLFDYLRLEVGAFLSKHPQ